ncbi:FKBP-type peptidyl-prolyl cis-trans isomerase [Brevundimonas sp. GCM10030266]|uniref:FKBP-type peptidyl-prolyl cis-trans isomerase n=1 Tax=Brevundimonas sp. GCM10030266 TaxID=3273386 RepID=UPI003605D5E5
MNSGWVKGVAALAMIAALAACNRGPETGNAEAEANLKAGQEFLAKNAKEEGIQTLPGGIQYKVVRSGPPGGESPDGNDLVRVDYEGSLTDGTVFDSSYERGQPAVFTLDSVIPGWSEAVQQMKVGDEWIVFVPADKGYGERSSPEIPANSVLVFRLKLLDLARTPGDGSISRATTANG